MSTVWSVHPPLQWADPRKTVAPGESRRQRPALLLLQLSYHSESSSGLRTRQALRVIPLGVSPTAEGCRRSPRNPTHPPGTISPRKPSPAPEGELHSPLPSRTHGSTEYTNPCWRFICLPWRVANTSRKAFPVHGEEVLKRIFVE